MTAPTTAELVRAYQTAHGYPDNREVTAEDIGVLLTELWYTTQVAETAQALFTHADELTEFVRVNDQAGIQGNLERHDAIRQAHTDALIAWGNSHTTPADSE
jgi:hypothetical protein